MTIENEGSNFNTEVEVLHWTEVFPNNIKLDTRMFLPSGHIVSRSCYLKGESRNHATPEKRYVRYDERYIVERLSATLKPLAKLSHENFHNVMDQVYMSIKGGE